MLDTGEMSYQHAVLGEMRRNASSSGSLRQVSSNQRIHTLPQSPLFSSTPVDTTILEQVKTKRSSDFVQVVSDAKPGDPNYKPLVVSRRIRRPSKHTSDSRSSSESASQNSRQIIENRDSRANSDLPSTIFGTVPNDLAFSLEELPESKPISATIDSGIAEMAGTRTVSEVEVDNPNDPEDSEDLSASMREDRAVSFLEALNELAASEEDIRAPRSLSLTDQVLEKQEELQEVQIPEVFDVEMDTVTRSDPVAIPSGSRTIEELKKVCPLLSFLSFSRKTCVSCNDSCRRQISADGLSE